MTKKHFIISSLKIIFYIAILFIAILTFKGTAKAGCVSMSIWSEGDSWGNWVPFWWCTDKDTYNPGESIYVTASGGYVPQASAWSCISLTAHVDNYPDTEGSDDIVTHGCLQWCCMGNSGGRYYTAPSSPGTHAMYFGGGVAGWWGQWRYAYTSINFSVVPPPPTVSLSANPTDIYGSGNSTLTWTTTNSPTSISSNFGAWPPAGGSRQVTPSAGANYYWVTVSNAAGVPASDSTYVYVHPGNFSLNSITRTCENEISKNILSWGQSLGANKYNIYRDGGYIGCVGSGCALPLSTTYKDDTVTYNSTYTYQVYAANAPGYTTPSNAVTSQPAYYCKKPHVTISANPINITLGGKSTLTWSATNVSHVDITNTGYAYNGGITSFSNQTREVQPTQTTTYLITGSNPCVTAGYCTAATMSTRVYVGTGKAELGGDVYSGNIINDNSGKFQFDPKSVLAAKASIDVPGSPGVTWQIPNYDFILWGLTQEKMKKTRDELIKGRDSVNFHQFSGVWCLDSGNKDNPSACIGQGDGVWYVNGDLRLKDVTFSGRGTIIVSGMLYINGDIKYVDDSTNNSLGFIVDKDIDISKDIYLIEGAFFSFGTIYFR